ncbi:MAG TPA: hypothetical protein PKE64_01750 [Anaerolineae bacterium]|nr:hypothetical protein [Anaerolineae bacterium]HMR62710.1 hypothetical protein [Anaerolineae bacterium]
MTTKLKIDLVQGVLEVEGSETFVKAIYSDFKAHFVSDETAEEPIQAKRRRRKPEKLVKEKAEAATGPDAEDKVEPVEEVDFKTEEEEPQKVGAGKRAYTLVEDLDFSSVNGRPSLVEYVDTKFPITNEERILVFLHYLQHLMQLPAITPDHVYTCFKVTKIRVPFSIENTLQATAKQRRWIKVAKDGTLSVTPAGKLYVENQLPKKIKS